MRSSSELPRVVNHGRVAGFGNTLCNVRALMAVCVAALATVVLADRFVARETVDVTVEMTVSEGSWARVYWNGGGTPKLLPILPNRRFEYRYGDLPAELRSLRLDPTDRANALITIHRIALHAGGRRVRTIGPQELASWHSTNIGQVQIGLDGATMRSANGAPTLESDLRVLVPHGPELLRRAVFLLRHPESTAVVLIGFFMLFLAAGCTTAVGRRHAALAFGIHAAAFAVAWAIPQVMGRPPGVLATVGQAAFEGYPKSADYAIGFALAGVALLLSFLLFRISKNRPDTELREPNLCEQFRPGRGWLVASFCGLSILLLALWQPHLEGELAALRSPASLPSGLWDWNNWIVWQYLVRSGFVPLRDFWFPYSGQYVQMLSFPWGALALWLHHVAILVYLAIALFLLLRSPARTAVIFFCILIPITTGQLTSWSRYILALDVAIAYLAIDHSLRKIQLAHALFAIGSAYAFFWEPAQLSYALAGICAATVYRLASYFREQDLANARREMAADLRRGLLGEVLPASICISGVMLWFARNGQLRGLTDFYRSIGAQADYGALHAAVASWLLPPLGALSVYFVVFYVLAIGLYECIARRGYHPYRAAILGIGVIAFMALQKHVLRPPCDKQLLIYVFTAILLYVVLVWHRRNVAQTAIAGAFVGVLVGVLVINEAGRICLIRLTHAATLAEANVRAASVADREVVLRREYTRERYRALPETRIVEALERELGMTPEDRLFVLSGSQLLYLLRNQNTPYQINGYNSSPVLEQQRVVAWLERYQPRYAVWDSLDRQFDGVPYATRLPVIYTYMAERYVPVSTVDHVLILRRCRTGEAPDPDFWRNSIGTAELGHIPQLSALEHSQVCRGGRGDCAPYLTIEPIEPASVRPGVTDVVVSARNATYHVQFDLVPGCPRYLIRLDRLWFWPFVQETSSSLQITSEPGLRVLRAEYDASTLY